MWDHEDYESIFINYPDGVKKIDRSVQSKLLIKIDIIDIEWVIHLVLLRLLQTCMKILQKILFKKKSICF